MDQKRGQEHTAALEQRVGEQQRGRSGPRACEPCRRAGGACLPGRAAQPANLRLAQCPALFPLIHLRPVPGPSTATSEGRMCAKDVTRSCARRLEPTLISRERGWAARVKAAVWASGDILLTRAGPWTRLRVARGETFSETGLRTRPERSSVHVGLVRQVPRSTQSTHVAHLPPPRPSSLSASTRSGDVRSSTARVPRAARQLPPKTSGHSSTHKRSCLPPRWLTWWPAQPVCRERGPLPSRRRARAPPLVPPPPHAALSPSLPTVVAVPHVLPTPPRRTPQQGSRLMS